VGGGSECRLWSWSLVFLEAVDEGARGRFFILKVVGVGDLFVHNSGFTSIVIESSDGIDTSYDKVWMVVDLEQIAQKR
jgi:hypothetical protein